MTVSVKCVRMIHTGGTGKFYEAFLICATSGRETKDDDFEHFAVVKRWGPNKNIANGGQVKVERFSTHALASIEYFKTVNKKTVKKADGVYRPVVNSSRSGLISHDHADGNKAQFYDDREFVLRMAESVSSVKHRAEIVRVLEIDADIDAIESGRSDKVLEESFEAECEPEVELNRSQNWGTW